MLNLVIISSVIKTINKKLSYTDIRSVFSHEERYIQTLNTIDSITNFYNDKYIVLIEGSVIPIEWENELKGKVNFYYNINDDKKNIEYKKYVDSEIKGIGEVSLLYSYLSSDHFNSIKSNINNIMKISGRYFFKDSAINIDEIYLNYDDSYNKIIAYIDNSDIRCMSTVCYSLDKTEIDGYVNILRDAFENSGLIDGNLSIEQYFYKYFINNKKIINYRKFGVCGYCAVDNEFYYI